MTDSTTEEDVRELRRIWESMEMAPDPNPVWLGGGVNLRFNVADALKTVYLSAKIYFKTKTLPVTMDPGTLLGIGKDVYDLVVAALDALRQKLNKSVYTLAVVLSKQEASIAEEDLRKAVQDFVEAGKHADLPWYAGITNDHIKETAAKLAEATGFKDLLAAIEKEELAEKEPDGKWRFKPRHFAWRGEMD